MNRSRLCREIIRLSEIMTTLRSERGCPWDAAQTPESLRPYILEEAHEVLEAIDEGAPDSIRDELGDLLLQVVFQARIFEEKGEFDLSEVAGSISDKLVRRHPHVFGQKKTASPGDLDAQWARIKAEEHSKRGRAADPLGRLPRHFPALMKAAKVIDHGSGGLEENKEALLDRLEGSLFEMRNALEDESERRERILGELLFGIVALARKLNLHPEDVLRRTVNGHIGDLRGLSGHENEVGNDSLSGKKQRPGT